MTVPAQPGFGEQAGLGAAYSTPWLICRPAGDRWASRVANEILADINVRGGQARSQVAEELENPNVVSAYGTLVLVMPCNFEPGAAAAALKPLSDVLTAYRRLRPARLEARARPDSPPRWEVGVAIGYALPAVLRLPRVTRDFASVDRWHDVAGNISIDNLGSSDIRLSKSREAVVEFLASQNHSYADATTMSTSQVEVLSAEAWSIVRSVGITSFGDCQKVVHIINRIRNDYFENPRRPALHRPYGKSIQKNALDAILDGSSEASGMRVTGDPLTLSRAARKAKESLVSELPSFSPGYHLQKQLRSSYHAANFIVSQGDTQVGRRQRHRRDPS